MNDEFPDFLDKTKYSLFLNGEKAKYGVAVIYKKNINIKDIKVCNEILGLESRLQMIYVESLKLNILNVYTPNGNPLSDNVKIQFKIKWYNELYKICENLIEERQEIIVGGDFNVIENTKDALNFKEWENDALGHIKIRTKFREICSTGLINLSRIFKKPGKVFSFWDYQRACWERNDGILIDHFLASPGIAQNVLELNYETSFRDLNRPSDHIPFWLKLNI